MRSTSLWILESGTTGLLDFFRHAARAQVAFHPEISGDGQGLFTRRVFEFTHIPEGTQSVVGERLMVESLKMGSRPFGYHASTLSFSSYYSLLSRPFMVFR